MAVTVELVHMSWLSVTYTDTDDLVEAKARALVTPLEELTLDGETTFVKDAYRASEEGNGS